MNENQVENPNKSKLAGSFAEDPRLKEIKTELIEGFEKTTGKDMFSEAGQNFMYGDPSAFTRGEKSVNLEQRMTKTFRERFPEDAKAYEAMEKVRVYEKPEDDPAIKKTYGDITLRANNDIKSAGANTFEGALSWQSNASMHKWIDFVQQYPEKAKAYRETFEPVKKAFETYEDMKEREKAESERLEEQRKLEDDYSQLDKQNLVLKRIEKDKEAMRDVRKKLGIPFTEDEIQNSEAFAKVEKIKGQIAEAERDFLDLPENIEDGEDSVFEDFANSEEFSKLQEELEESAEEAREKFIEDTTNDVVKRWSNEFKNAENDVVAEKLFRLKFPVYFRENLKNSDSDITHTVFHFKTIKNDSGREVFYFEKIDIQNVSQDAYLEKTKKPEYNEEELKKILILILMQILN